MRVWHFSEQSYHPGWDKTTGPIRIEVPSELCDPVESGDLFNRYLDEWMLADELGFDIMLNEHHSTMSCMSASCSLPLAILARQTRRARLLALGFPLANRLDPFRVAEEIAMIDVISRGRLEIGFVKGIPYELYASNLNPVRIMDRFWEAHDLILKSLAHHDGPFSWEGEYFNYRAVNVWPRCYQKPHPPVWMPSANIDSTTEIARRGYVCAAFFDAGGAKQMFAAYRDAYRAQFAQEAGADRLAFLGMVVVADNEAEAERRGEMMKGYLRILGRSPPGTTSPSGYRPIGDTVAMLRASVPGVSTNYAKIQMLDGRPLPRNPSNDDLASAGALIAGTPDQVFAILKRLHDAVGGFGNLLLMGQAGTLPHAETVDSLTLFAKEVYPRLQELG